MSAASRVTRLSELNPCVLIIILYKKQCRVHMGNESIRLGEIPP